MSTIRITIDEEEILICHTVNIRREITRYTLRNGTSQPRNTSILVPFAEAKATAP